MYVSFRGTSFFGVLQNGIVSLFLRKKTVSSFKKNSKHIFFRKDTQKKNNNSKFRKDKKDRKDRKDRRNKKKRTVFFNLRRNLKKRLKKKEQLPNQKTILKSEKIKNCFFLKTEKCLLPTAKGKFYLISLQPILKYKSLWLREAQQLSRINFYILKFAHSCFNIFNRKKTNNLFGSKQYWLQLKQLVQYYLQFVLWKKKIQTIHSTKQKANHILDLLLTNLAVNGLTLGFSRPFKKNEDFVIKKFYIYKVDCIKCKLLGVGTKKSFEKTTNFLKKIKTCLCFFKGNGIFFCFSPLQKPLRQLLC